MTSMNYGRMQHKERRNGRLGALPEPTWLSTAKSEASSVPSVVPIESGYLSDDFRDEISSLDDKNLNATSSKGPREAFPKDEDFFPGGVTFEGTFFNSFDFYPDWSFVEKIEKETKRKEEGLEHAEKVQTRPEAFETDNFSKSHSMLQTKTDDSELQSESSRPIILVKPSALKLDAWSKVFVRKKDQFKYRSFKNEKRVSRKKKKPIVESIVPPYAIPLIEKRDDTEQVGYRPENFPSFHSFPKESLPTFDNEPNFFHPNVRDDNQCREGMKIGPLRPNTKLRLAAQERPRDLSGVLELEDNIDIPPSSFWSFEERDDAPSDERRAYDEKRRQKQSDKMKKGETVKFKSKGTTVDVIPEFPVDGDYSTIFSGNTENLPLLKAWRMTMVDCNQCKTKKVRNKLDAKKNRAEAKKKYIEDLWERKQFYWKYESVEEMRREQRKELDTLVLRIAPETESTPQGGFIEMPLGIQLSTITEGDEDVTPCCSPRSSTRSARTATFGAGKFQQSDVKMTFNTPVRNLLGDSNEDDANLDEVEFFPAQPQKHLPNQEHLRRNRGSSHRRGDLSVDEILIPDMLDDSYTFNSKDEMSDITEDYIHIPFSSPLYNKVLKAFREASKNRGKNQGDGETNFLSSVLI